MFLPAKIDLYADRYTPFYLPLQIVGADLTGAVFKGQVRDAKNGGAVRAECQIALTDVQVLGGIAYSTLEMTIGEVVMEAMPLSPALEDDIRLYWDMHISPPLGVKQVYFAGEFIVRGGVTQ